MTDPRLTPASGQEPEIGLGPEARRRRLEQIDRGERVANVEHFDRRMRIAPRDIHHASRYAVSHQVNRRCVGIPADEDGLLNLDSADSALSTRKSRIAGFAR